jgi:carbon-monoxide dehydrogenase large subunit
VIGQALRRVEDERYLTGRAVYLDDLTLPGCLHMAVWRSPVAHARIVRVDASAAAARPGIRAVLTPADMKAPLKPIRADAPEGALLSKRWPLAVERVRHVGEAVAVIVAESPQAARDALAALVVELDPLPAVAGLEAAAEPGAPRLYEEFPSNRVFTTVTGKGDVDAAFAQAEVVVGRRQVNQRLAAVPMETRGVIADCNPENGQITVWSSTQAPHSVRATIAQYFGISKTKVRVIAPEVGGGFGSKGSVYAEDLLAVHLATQLGAPVKWVEDRSESFRATYQGRGQVQAIELAARRDGTVLAIRSQVLADMGAHVEGFGGYVPTSTANLQTGCYRFAASRCELTGVYTNTTPTGPYRGAGRPEAAYLIERAMDALARELAMDPVELRFKNFIPKEAFPYDSAGELTYDSGDYAGVLEKLVAVCDYPALRAQQAAQRGEGRLIGIGISTYVELAAPGPADVCVVRLERDGRATVLTGSMPHGQGHETTWAQIVAAELGLPMERITVRHGDTATAPFAIGTWGSRSAAVSGSAVLVTTRILREHLSKLAAGALEAAETDLVFADGKVHVRGMPGRGIAIAELAASGVPTHDGRSRVMSARGEFDPPSLVFPFGAHLAMVEVDRETGHVRLLRYVAVDDCGRMINPRIVAGQVHGGVAQGVAQALWEEVVYDADAQPLASSLVSYFIPTALELPFIEVDHTVTPTPLNPLGAKGIGEGGTTGSTPCAVNAVADALWPLGVREVDMPLTPERVWRLVNQHR